MQVILKIKVNRTNNVFWNNKDKVSSFDFKNLPGVIVDLGSWQITFEESNFLLGQLPDNPIKFLETINSQPINELFKQTILICIDNSIFNDLHRFFILLRQLIHFLFFFLILNIPGQLNNIQQQLKCINWKLYLFNNMTKCNYYDFICMLVS